ncbi:hypothetical protein D3C86_1585830 [compost metagenome]
MRQPSERRASRTKSQKTSQAEHADRRQPQDAVDHLQQAIAARPEEIHHGAPLTRLDVGHAQREQHAEDHDSQNRPFRRRLKDIGRQQAAHELAHIGRHDLRIRSRG